MESKNDYETYTLLCMARENDGIWMNEYEIYTDDGEDDIVRQRFNSLKSSLKELKYYEPLSRLARDEIAQYSKTRTTSEYDYIHRCYARNKNLTKNNDPLNLKQDNRKSNHHKRLDSSTNLLRKPTRPAPLRRYKKE